MLSTGLLWSESLIDQLSDDEMRDAFVADQVRMRIALMIRALREQEGRNWSQTEFARRLGKTQSVVSRLEDPDYGKLSVTTLLEVAAAYKLPLWIDFPEWEDWLLRMKDFSRDSMHRREFDRGRLMTLAQSSIGASASTPVRTTAGGATTTTRAGLTSDSSAMAEQKTEATPMSHPKAA